MLKNLILFLLMCTLLSLPALALFQAGEGAKDAQSHEMSYTNSLMMRFSLGNIGENVETLIHFDLAYT
jgi:hypothetical protein